MEHVSGMDGSVLDGESVPLLSLPPQRVVDTSSAHMKSLLLPSSRDGFSFNTREMRRSKMSVHMSDVSTGTHVAVPTPDGSFYAPPDPPLVRAGGATTVVPTSSVHPAQTPNVIRDADEENASPLTPLDTGSVITGSVTAGSVTKDASPALAAQPFRVAESHLSGPDDDERTIAAGDTTGPVFARAPPIAFPFPMPTHREASDDASGRVPFLDAAATETATRSLASAVPVAVSAAASQAPAPPAGLLLPPFPKRVEGVPLPATDRASSSSSADPPSSASSVFAYVAIGVAILVAVTCIVTHLLVARLVTRLSTNATTKPVASPLPAAASERGDGDGTDNSLFY